MSLQKEIKTFLKVYLFTWIFTFFLFLLNLMNPNITFKQVMEGYWMTISSTSGLVLQHILVLCFYLIFIITRYFVRVYRKKGSKVFLRRFFLRFILPIVLVIISLRLIINSNTNENFNYEWDHSIENKTDSIQHLFAQDGKHRGMTVYDFGRSNSIDISELIKNNIEWVVILPYFYQEDEQTNSIRNPKEIGRWSRRDSAFIKSIETLHEHDIKVHLKPHLWMSSGWRSNINFDTEEDWNTWFESYRKTMLHYAMMAEQTQTELLCIGTELRSSIEHQPEKWSLLVSEIKQIYSGKLTYAANWDSTFSHIPFWKEMDYIGIQAYFPLTQNASPKLSEIKQGWNRHVTTLEELSKQYDKKILFTEIGYRPDESATKAPWEWGSALAPLFKKKSDKTQYLAFEAMFSQVWKQPWFAGSYIWQWNNSDFEIKERPAQNSVAKWYSKDFLQEPTDHLNHDENH